MPNPWDIPTRPTKGDKNPTPIFTAVGRCLSSWEFIEFDLSEMFAIFTGSTPKSTSVRPAMRAYGIIISYRTRSAALNAAAKAFFNINKRTGLERSFKNILKKCDGWANRRNDLAHAAVVKTELVPAFCLWPPPYATNKYPLDTRQASFCYTAAQIRKFNTAFRKLRRQTKDFVDRLDKRAIEIRARKEPRPAQGELHS